MSPDLNQYRTNEVVLTKIINAVVEFRDGVVLEYRSLAFKYNPRELVHSLEQANIPMRTVRAVVYVCCKYKMYVCGDII